MDCYLINGSEENIKLSNFLEENKLSIKRFAALVGGIFRNSAIPRTLQRKDFKFDEKWRDSVSIIKKIQEVISVLKLNSQIRSCVYDNNYFWIAMKSFV